MAFKFDKNQADSIIINDEIALVDDEIRRKKTMTIQKAINITWHHTKIIKADRDKARNLHEPGKFVEVFIDAPLRVLEERDPKGLYKKARSGEIQQFTGIYATYEAPENPVIHLYQ